MPPQIATTQRGDLSGNTTHRTKPQSRRMMSDRCPMQTRSHPYQPLSVSIGSPCQHSIDIKWAVMPLSRRSLGQPRRLILVAPCEPLVKNDCSLCRFATSAEAAIPFKLTSRSRGPEHTAEEATSSLVDRPWHRQSQLLALIGEAGRRQTFPLLNVDRHCRGDAGSSALLSLTQCLGSTCLRAA
jgi:hypothetical protein